MSGLTIQGNSIFSESTNSTFHVNTKTIIKEEQNTSQNKKNGVETSKDGDTLELSAEGSALAKKTTATESGSSSDSSSGSTNDLSSYTATELKEMLQNGEITKAEYDAEIASRSSSTSAAE